MLKLASGNAVCFSNLSAPAQKSLSGAFTTRQNSSGNAPPVELCTDGVLRLLEQTNADITLDRVCLLDPKAEQELTPSDGDGRFSWFLFGGILGDDPPRDRTAQLRTLGFPCRHLGPVQMTTDTALGVTKLVVVDKGVLPSLFIDEDAAHRNTVPLSQIEFVDFPTITFNAKESVEMPFRYISKSGMPLLPDGMKDLLYRDLNQSFDI